MTTPLDRARREFDHDGFTLFGGFFGPGGYGEHRFESVEVGSVRREIGRSSVDVRLEPGCGARLDFRMARYVNPPALAHPWNRN